MTGHEDVAELVQRILAGESAAEEVLVERFQHGVSVIIRQIVHDAAAAADLAQDALRLALEKIRNGEVREPDRLSGFVCGVARNHALGYVRRPKREAALDEARVHATQASQLTNLLNRERARIVRQVLREVSPPRYREILYRFYIAEESKEAICADLGLTSLHFNRVLWRARDRYRELYEKTIAVGQKGA